MSLLNYYWTDGSAGAPPDEKYAPRCMLPQQSKSACKTPICMQDPNLHLWSKFDRAYIVYVHFCTGGPNLHVGSQSACEVSICMLGCRFRPHMQNQTPCSVCRTEFNVLQELFSKPIISTHVTQCVTG